MFKIFDRVLISFIHQDSCGYNIYLLCKLSGSQRLSLSVIPQIVTGQITCGLFLKRYRDLEQKPSLVKLTQRCVIENTIAKTNYHIHLVFSERKMLEQPEVKVATRNMFYDEQGKHRRTKKEVLDENE